jgi:hypothetical protein
MVMGVYRSCCNFSWSLEEGVIDAALDRWDRAPQLGYAIGNATEIGESKNLQDAHPTPMYYCIITHSPNSILEDGKGRYFIEPWTNTTATTAWSWTNIYNIYISVQ